MIYERIRPKTRKEARLRRDLVLFIAGAAFISIISAIWRADSIHVYEEEIYRLEQNISRAREEIRWLNNSMTEQEAYVWE